MIGKVTVFVLIIAASMSILCGCGNSKSEIQKLMTQFEHSCNALDINAILDCIDPEISDKIKLATGIAGLFTDKNSNELMEELAGMLTGDSSLNASDFFSSIKIETSDIKTNKQAGTANAIVEYRIAGENFKKETSFKYIYAADKWYISSFNLK